MRTRGGEEGFEAAPIFVCAIFFAAGEFPKAPVANNDKWSEGPQRLVALLGGERGARRKVPPPSTTPRAPGEEYPGVEATATPATKLRPINSSESARAGRGVGVGDELNDGVDVLVAEGVIEGVRLKLTLPLFNELVDSVDVACEDIDIDAVTVGEKVAIEPVGLWLNTDVTLPPPKLAL
jgi:hypothetical protein